MKPVRIKNKSDYEAAQKYILEMLQRKTIPKSVISETMLVFEALFHEIVEQNENEGVTVTLLGREQLGLISICFTYEGKMFVPGKEAAENFSPENKILQSYADKVDYSYQSGYNKIRITIRRSGIKVMLPSVIAIAAAILVYFILQPLLREETQQQLFSNVVFPLEMLFRNEMMMIGAPVTFLSLMKNLTDTYIVSERNSGVVKIRRRVILSSAIAVGLAAAAAFVLSGIVSERGVSFSAASKMKVDMTFQEFLGSLLPSDIFAPFQMISPFPLIIVSAIFTHALCSVGKHFDKLKNAIDTCYALFSRMLGIIMSALPVFAFLSILDFNLTDGPRSILYLAQLTLAVAVSSIFMIVYYGIRLKMSGTGVVPFTKKLIPLLGENYMINSALDAAPYNIRYCARAFNMDRKRLEVSIPMLAQINLDGNCFFITFIMLTFMLTTNTKFGWANIVLIALLVFYLSLGAPNQPGSCLIGVLIILTYMNATRLIPLAIYCEVAYGNLLNLTNITGDIVTAAEFDRKEKAGT